MRIALPSLLLLLAAAPAAAETCKYVDKDGNVTYSNIAVKNARKLNCFQEPAPPMPDPATESLSPPSVGTGTGSPQVEPLTQRKRDNDRRQILEEELLQEQQALTDAKQALAEQEALRYGNERNYARVLERLKPFQEAVALHERNVASLKQELANLK